MLPIMIRLSFFLLFCFPLFLLAQTPVVQFSFEETTGVTTTNEGISGADFLIQNHFDNPERFDAPFGKALRLDGYSTWAENNNFDVPNVTDRMAIEVWWATECFNEQPVGLISQVNSSAGFAVKARPYGQVFFQFFADDQLLFFNTSQQLKPYQWNHIIAQVDLPAQVAEIWVNGELWGTKDLDPKTELNFAETTMYIARGNDAPMFNQFLLNVANGALDEVRIFNQTFTSTEITDRFNAVGLVETDLEIDPDLRHAGDHLRPRFHVMPNTAWTNESYGLTYYDGQYHMFSQKNTNSPTLFFMHWGHYSSPDLVSWKEERMSLSPQPGFSDFGCWSGTTFFDDQGEPVISYTGVNGQIAGIGMAYPLDDQLMEWELEMANPVVPTAPPNIPNLDFRDPYIIKNGDFFYMMVGSGRAGNNGGFLASYRSSDLVNWDPIDPIFEYSNIAEAGIFWEMPALVQFENGDWMVVVTPVYAASPAKTLYWIGDFSNEKFIPYHPEPKNFEHNIRLLLSPAFGKDEEGRLTYIGIVPEDRNVEDQITAGWRQTFSIPRVVRLLEDGNIGHYPHPNLCRLRGAQTTIENRIIQPGTNFNLPEIEGGQQFEIEMTIVPEPGSEFSLQILKNDAASMFTSIYGDLSIDRLGINRQLSSPYSTTEDNRFSPYLFRDTVQIRAFFDHSILEVFVDNLTVMSTRVYPGEDQVLVDFVVPEGSVEVVRLDYWELGDKEDSYPEEVCEPEYLPNSFLTHTREVMDLNTLLNVFPNPVEDEITIDELGMGWSPPFYLGFYSSDGQLLLEKRIASLPDTVDLSGISKGVYFLKLTGKDGTATGKLIKE